MLADIEPGDQNAAKYLAVVRQHIPQRPQVAPMSGGAPDARTLAAATVRHQGALPPRLPYLYASNLLPVPFRRLIIVASMLGLYGTDVCTHIHVTPDS